MGRKIKNRGRNKKKKRNPPHHIIPSSRKGPDEEFNKIYPPLHIHTQYHILFANWTPEEVVKTLRVFWRGNDEKISRYFERPNRRKAYEILFGGKKQKEIEEYLEEVWFNPVTSPYGFFQKDP